MYDISYLREVKTDKVSPASDVALTLGDSGDTITIPSGATITNSGTATGFGSLAWQAVQTSSPITGASGKAYPVNTTSGAITVTLPAGSAGDIIEIIDYAGTFDSNTCTIGRNSQKIAGASADMTVTTARAGLELVFTDSTQGWLLTEL